jgi:hypothetical protein
MNTLRNSVFICRSKVPARNGGSKLRAGSYQRRMRTRRCYFLARLDRPFICKRHTVHLFVRQLPWRDSLHYVADKGTKGCADDLPYGVKHSVSVSKRTSCRRTLWPMSFFKNVGPRSTYGLFARIVLSICHWLRLCGAIMANIDFERTPIAGPNETKIFGP